MGKAWGNIREVCESISCLEKYVFIWLFGTIVGSIERQAVKLYDGMMCSVLAGRVRAQVFSEEFFMWSYSKKYYFVGVSLSFAYW